MLSLPELKNQQVRDLAYSCFSEPLISNFNQFESETAPAHCSLGLTEKRIDWLRQLDRSPNRLLAFLDQVRPRRLGLYHEALWHFFLQHDDEVELVSHNLQVAQDGKTVGEFDVIYRDLKGNRYVHLELAFKVYLQAGSGEEISLAQWLGPNVNDRLERKLEHMLNHQCRLSLHDAGREKLQAMGVGQIHREISLRGYLLGHDRFDPGNNLPDQVNPDCSKGSWLPVSKIVPILDRHERWMPLSRLEWISPVGNDPETGYAPSEFADYLRQQVEQSDLPIMIAALDASKLTRPNEAARIMVTPDSWPETR